MTRGRPEPSPAMSHISPAQWLPLVKGLTDALQSEQRLIDELIGIMRAQRDAVAADDLQAVDDSVFSVQRVLHTLAEARKRRRALNVRFGQSEDVALRDLLESMGPYANDDLQGARDTLKVSARTLASEVTTNRQILREALTTGEEMVRTLAGFAAPRVGYGETLGSGDPMRGSFLVNRQA